MGTIAASRHMVPARRGRGGAARVPRAPDLEAGWLSRLLPHIELLADSFRLAFRRRRVAPVYERIGQAMVQEALK
jgi:hypothetical protein